MPKEAIDVRLYRPPIGRPGSLVTSDTKSGSIK